MQRRLTAHDWAAIFRVVAASISVRHTLDALHLRATCRAAQLGYDCAVQAGWIPLAAHRSAEPEEDGATCMWVSGWFPVSHRSFGIPTTRQLVDDGGETVASAAVVVRLEHRMVPHHEVAALFGLRHSATQWFVPQLIVAETEQPSGSEHDKGGAFDDGSGAVRCVKPAKVVRFQLAATTKAATLAMPPPDASTAAGGRPSSLKFHVFASLHLVAFDTTGLDCIRHVTDGFLHGCSSLTSVDLAGFRNVRSIGSSFLGRCTSLRVVDLAPLTSVTTIADAFLDYCSALTALDTLGLSSVTDIGSAFCYGAAALTSVDVRGLTSVTRISERWLGQCYALEHFSSRWTATTSPFGKLREIGSSFMVQCTGLKSVDLSGFTAVTLINADCLGQCSALESFSSEGLGCVEVLGTGFLNRCSSLTALNTNGFARLRTLGAGFMFGCCSLQSFSTTGLGNVAAINSHFMYEATSLHRFDASGLTSVTALGSHFLGGCWYLEELDLVAMAKVTSVGAECFNGVPHGTVQRSAASWPAALRIAHRTANSGL
jgi:hypothetical protein